MASPTPAERARTVAELGRVGALATLTSEFQPLVTMVPFLADGSGDPIMVLTNLEPHVQHAWHHRKAGLLIGDTLSLLGELSEVPGIQQLDLQERYLHAHPDAVDRVESLDCSWLRLHVHHARFDVGAGPWLELLDYATAEPDPLAPREQMLLQLISAAFEPQALVLLTRAVGGHVHATSAQPIAVDRYGLEVATIDPSGPATARIAFRERMDTPNAVLTALAFELHLAEERESLAIRGVMAADVASAEALVLGSPGSFDGPGSFDRPALFDALPGHPTPM